MMDMECIRCGGEFRAYPSEVARGRRYCGVLCRNSSNAVVHGMKGTREYSSWQAMKNRCTNTSHKDYPGWGGRGITFCERWQRFENFYADMGPRPEDTTLDRIDVNGNYEPGNCRWATAAVQVVNRRKW